MIEKLEPGTYVVAVSGGVDSMALLHMLWRSSRENTINLVVAHFDHGIRPDSELDRKLVQDFAERNGLPFVFHEGRLGTNASEAAAREARYRFLHKVREASGAAAIITAHHQDDLLETAIHNVLRGTGRRGLSSLQDRPDIRRPLLHLSKAELEAYAGAHELIWREDSTNRDTAYTRNYIRHNIVPKFSATQKKQLLSHISKTGQLNQEIDNLLADHLQQHLGGHVMNRQWFTGLSHQMAREVMTTWLRNLGVSQFDKKLLEQLIIAAKTYKPGKYASVNGTFRMQVGQDNLALVKVDR